MPKQKVLKKFPLNNNKSQKLVAYQLKNFSAVRNDKPPIKNENIIPPKNSNIFLAVLVNNGVTNPTVNHTKAKLL